MVTPSAGAVVLVRFPFSDLSSAKLRPAMVLAPSGDADWILSQITSNPYADLEAIEINDKSFTIGGLLKRSYLRPRKLFTARSTLIIQQVGVLKPDLHLKIVKFIVSVLENGVEENRLNSMVN